MDRGPVYEDTGSVYMVVNTRFHWPLFFSPTAGKVSPDVATPSPSNAASLPEQSASAGTNAHYRMTDPVEWGIEDVVRYFSVHGFPEQCNAFREQVSGGYRV